MDTDVEGRNKESPFLPALSQEISAHCSLPTLPGPWAEAGGQQELATVGAFPAHVWTLVVTPWAPDSSPRAFLCSIFVAEP